MGLPGRIGSFDRNALPPALLERARNQASATVYEAADQRGAMDAGINAVVPGMRLCGPAVTVRCQPADNLTLHAAVAVTQPGDVIVADVGDFIEAGHWGEILTVAAQARKGAGVVINGGVRDVEAAQRRGFPVFARGISMKATVKRVFGEINTSIACGNVVVNPGDLVFADDDGVVVVRADRVEDVLHAAMEREDREASVIGRLENGELTLDILGFRQALDEQGVRIEEAGNDR